MSIPEFGNEDETSFAKEKKYIGNFKKAILLVAGAAVQKYMTALDKEQEILMNVADMFINTYLAESALLRLMKLTETFGEASTKLQSDIVSVYIFDAAEKILKAGKEAINRFAEGDELNIMQMGLRRFTKVPPYNTISARRSIAEKMIEENGYCF